MLAFAAPLLSAILLAQPVPESKVAGTVVDEQANRSPVPRSCCTRRQSELQRRSGRGKSQTDPAADSISRHRRWAESTATASTSGHSKRDSPSLR